MCLAKKKIFKLLKTLLLFSTIYLIKTEKNEENGKRNKQNKYYARQELL